MERLVVLLVLGVLAVVVASLLQRRRPDPPSAPSYRAPRQLDRADFAEPEVPLLIAVFSSRSCSTCPEVWAEVVSRQAPGRAVQEIAVQDDDSLHRRYKIDGVPTTVVADAEGVVHAAFFGPFAADELDEALETVEAGR